MVQKTKHVNAEPLGDLLREQRENSSIELKTVSRTTRIPINTLRAMEADEYDSLPPEAFAQGFYVIYAKFLGLDADYVVEQYHRHNQEAGKEKKQTPVPAKLHSQIKPMATRPSIRPGTILGFSLVLLIIIGALISWFFAWNPASYLSEKIRSNGQNSNVDQTDDMTNTHDLEKIQYHLQAHFPSITKVTIVKDDNHPENYLFQTGDTKCWMAKSNITMILPEKTNVRLTLNGLVHPLPDPKYGMVTVKIPNQ